VEFGDVELSRNDATPSPFARRIMGYIAFWPGSTTIEEAASASP
jgi:hypothetical protein